MTVLRPVLHARFVLLGRAEEVCGGTIGCGPMDTETGLGKLVFEMVCCILDPWTEPGGSWIERVGPDVGEFV